MRLQLLALAVCAAAYFLNPLCGSARQTTSTNTQPNAARSGSTNSDQNALRRFQQWTENYAKAGASEKSQLHAEGFELATGRRKAFAALIESNPKEALRQAVPALMRKQLPPEVIPLLEELVSGHGDFLVLAALPKPGAKMTARPVERFVILNGKRYEAFVYGRRMTQVTRTNIPIHGVAIGDKLAVHEDAGESSDSQQTPEPNEHDHGDVGRPGPTPWTSGIKKVLFIRVNFPDDLTESISATNAVTMMNLASNWYSRVSYQITALDATVTPVLTLPNTKASYQSSGDYFVLLNDARAVAKTNGFDTANFDLDVVHFVPIFPGWGGRAFVGEKGAWFQGFFNVSVTCHEFGHNYGLWHANEWQTLDDSGIGPGNHIEYGDFFDNMGTSSDNDAFAIDEFHFNAYEKNLLGWLPDANVATVTTSGVYRIYALDAPALNSNAFHALRIKKDDRYYWGELRSLFTWMSWPPNGLMLHWSPWQNSGGGTHIIDATPASGFGQNDCPVVLGQTFTEPFVGFHLTVLRKNTNTTPVSLDVRVEFGTPPENRPPTVTVAASSTNVPQNTPATFTATASDPDGDELAYYWEFNNDYSDAPVGPNAPNATSRWQLYGHYPVRCTVSDMKGGTASAHVFMNVGSHPYQTIRGQILHQGTPVEGVRVNGNTPFPVNAYTDANGNYVLGNVPTNSPRTLFAVKPGWDFSPANFSNPVSVTSSIANINFSASPRTYNVSGQVYYRAGIPDVTVSLGTNSTLTDIGGNYSIPNLPAGVYHQLTASKPNYELRAVGWTNPIVLDWQSASGKDFERPFSLVSGVVSNVPFSPLVSISDPDSFANVFSINGGHWGYDIPVPRGQWNLVATHSGYTILPGNFTNPIVVSNGGPSQLVDLNFRTSPSDSYAISGNINASGQPVTGARVNAGSFSGFSDTIGNYILPGLSNGNYQVSASLQNYTFAPPTRNVTIAGNNVSEQDFVGQLAFLLTQMRATNAGFTFRLSSGPNRVIRIEASTNLVDWAMLATVTNTTGEMDFVDAPFSSPRRFYRAAMLP